jgi:hypothetical protein
LLQRGICQSYKLLTNITELLQRDTKETKAKKTTKESTGYAAQAQMLLFVEFFH